MAVLRIEEFTDPACPWAFSAEPGRLRLLWLYGESIEWRPRMVVLSRSPEEYAAKGYTPALMAEGMADIQRRFGMPIDPRPRARMAATVHACRAVVAARLHFPDREQALLRRLRIHAMAGELFDEPPVIARAAEEAGIDPLRLLRAWRDDPDVERVLEADAAVARRPTPAALALDHKLAAAEDGGRRYTCPSYEITRLDNGARLDVPGFQPAAVYEAAIANLAPELRRRALPSSVAEVLAWAGEPLATAEVAAICELDHAEARTELARVAREDAVGPDGWWTPAAVSERLAA
jgi:predicted DsbA family dithiol-disulfide isomerase